MFTFANKLFLMVTYKAILRIQKQRSDRKCPIAIRITTNRKSRFISLGYFIEEKYWNAKECRVLKSYQGHQMVNQLIQKKLADIGTLVVEKELIGFNLTSSQIKKTVNGNGIEYRYSYYMLKHIRDMEAMGKIDQAKSNKSRWKVFREFMDGEDLTFKQINEDFLRKYMAHLAIERKNTPRSITNHLITIRAIFNIAIRAGVVNPVNYPFGRGKISIRFPESTKIGLDIEEIKLIENLELLPGTEAFHTKNVFLFSFYLAGIRISDCISIKWQDIKKDRLYYIMGKNSKLVSLKIPQKAIKIIEHYRLVKKPDDIYLFPDLNKSNPLDLIDRLTKMRTAKKRHNNHLAKIARKLGITKKLTCHISRHSFGNIAGDQISPQMLQKLYRHSDIKTTMGYQANFITKEADDALDIVVGF